MIAKRYISFMWFPSPMPITNRLHELFIVSCWLNIKYFATYIY